MLKSHNDWIKPIHLCKRFQLHWGHEWVEKYICKTNNLNEFSLLMIAYFYIAAFDMSVGCIKIYSELSLSKTNAKKCCTNFLIEFLIYFYRKISLATSAFHHNRTKFLVIVIRQMTHLSCANLSSLTYRQCLKLFFSWPWPVFWKTIWN